MMENYFLRLKETLNEVETLRSELLKAASITAPSDTMKKQQQHQVYQYQPPVQTYGGAKPKQLGSASSDNLLASKSVPTTPSKSIARPNFATTQSPTSADLGTFNLFSFHYFNLFYRQKIILIFNRA